MIPSATGADLLYGVQVAAERLGVGRTTVYSLVNAGELERVKIGRRTLVTASSIARYVERLRATSDDSR